MARADPCEGVSYYIDNKLKRNLDKKVKDRLKHKDEDYVIVVDGQERAGKSTFAMQIGKYVDPTLNVNRICFTPDEFKEAIGNAKKGQCVIFDEAYRGLSSRGALSAVNKLLVSMMMEMGQKNLFVIIVLPTFYLLDKYVAIWRARGLFHVFESRRIKGYWRYYNKRKKKMLFNNPKFKSLYTYSAKFSSFRGRFYGKYPIDEKKYRAKKLRSLKNDLKKKKEDKYYKEICIWTYIMNKELNISQKEIAMLGKRYKLIKAQSSVSDRIVKCRDFKEIRNVTGANISN